MSTLSLLGYASALGGVRPGSAKAPSVLQQSSYLRALAKQGIQIKWDTIVAPDDHHNESKLLLIAKQCHQLGESVARLVREKQFFIVFGGDHSSAIGTWSGVFQAKKPLGLIWIDAHMDSNTPETSPSGNIHGMPLACLLGHGEKKLTQLFGNDQSVLNPEQVCLIGVRSFESGEEELLKRLKVRIFYMDEVKDRGLQAVFAEAKTIATNGTSGYGITLDIDAIDPIDAPGTGVREPNGLSARELCRVLTDVSGDPRLLGIEIAEFDPERDQDQLTEKLISHLLLRRKSPRP